MKDNWRYEERIGTRWPRLDLPPPIGMISTSSSLTWQEEVEQKDVELDVRRQVNKLCASGVLMSLHGQEF